jgi:hypothetical protein
MRSAVNIYQRAETELRMGRCVCVLWREVAGGAEHACDDLAVGLVGPELGHAEVGDPGAVVVVEQDVAALEVAVDHGGAAVLVHELQRPRAVQRDAQPRLPVQRRPRRRGGVQVALEAAVGHELEHQQPVALVGAVAQQPHQVRRVHPAQEVHLHAHGNIPVTATVSTLMANARYTYCSTLSAQ